MLLVDLEYIIYIYMCVCITTELRRERRETSEREYTNERKAFSVTHFTSNLSNHLPLLSPQDPLSFPLLRAERLTFIVNSTPNVRTWHFEYLELNCKHRSTRRLKPSHADGVNDPTIYWIVATHAVTLYTCVYARPSLSLSHFRQPWPRQLFRPSASLSSESPCETQFSKAFIEIYRSEWYITEGQFCFLLWFVWDGWLEI